MTLDFASIYSHGVVGTAEAGRLSSFQVRLACSGGAWFAGCPEAAHAVATRGSALHSCVAYSLLLSIAPTSSKKYLMLPVLFLVAGMRGLPSAAAEMVSEKKLRR